MTPALGIWARTLGWTAFAGATLVLVEAPRPEPRTPRPVALASGLGAGALLYACVVRRAPIAALGPPTPKTLTRSAILVLWAANEEVVWRRLVLGEALRGGAVVAVAASSVAFALMHRRRRATHVVTGAAFGGTYVGTGSLAASVVAHWLYNTLVAAGLPRARAPATEARA